MAKPMTKTEWKEWLEKAWTEAQKASHGEELLQELDWQICEREREESCAAKGEQ